MASGGEVATGGNQPMTQDGEQYESEQWLALHGSWLLISFGLLLVLLAVLFRDAATIAPEFGVMGSLAVILGTLLPRIEGPFRITRGSLEAVLRSVRRQVQGDPSIAPAMKDDVIELAEEKALIEAPPAAGRAETKARARAIYQEAANEVLVLEHNVRAYLEGQGWSVELRGEPGGIDLVAQRGDETMLVDIKKKQGLITRGDLLRWIAALSNSPFHRQNPTARLALFVWAPGVTEGGVAVARAGPVEIYADNQPLEHGRPMFKRLR